MKPKELKKNPKILKKTWKKRSEIFQEISRNFSAFVEKTVLIREIVRFLGLKKTVLIRNPYY